jgi:hypothetical protein
VGSEHRVTRLRGSTAVETSASAAKQGAATATQFQSSRTQTLVMPRTNVNRHCLRLIFGGDVWNVITVDRKWKNQVGIGRKTAGRCLCTDGRSPNKHATFTCSCGWSSAREHKKGYGMNATTNAANKCNCTKGETRPEPATIELEPKLTHVIPNGSQRTDRICERGLRCVTCDVQKVTNGMRRSNKKKIIKKIKKKKLKQIVNNIRENACG